MTSQQLQSSRLQDAIRIFQDDEYFPRTLTTKIKRLEFLRNIINEFLKPNNVTIPEEIKEDIVNKYEDWLIESIKTNNKQSIKSILNKLMKELLLVSKKMETLSILSTYTRWLSLWTRPEIDKKRIQFMQRSLQSSTTWSQMLEKINKTKQLRFRANSSKIPLMQQLFKEMKAEIKAQTINKFIDAVNKVVATKPLHRVVETKPLQRVVDAGLGQKLRSFLPQGSVYNVSRSFRQDSIKTSRSMDLNFNPYWKIKISDLIAYPKKLSYTIELHLSNNQIDDLECSIVARALSRLPNLQTLDLSQNRFSDAGLTQLASSLSQLQHLQNLNVSKNNIHDAGLTLLFKLMKLQSLDLSNNKITLEHTTLMDPLPNLQMLDLSYNEEISNAGCIQLADVLLQVPNLQTLNLTRYNNFNIVGYRKLIGVLHNLPNLQTLCGMNCTEVASVLPRLHHLQTLQLMLVCTNIPKCMELINVLRQLPKLQTLHLTAMIGEAGYIELASVLHHLPNLQTLCLNKSNITDNDCAQLTGVLPELSNLQTLDLSHNRINNMGCSMLIDVLPQLSNLQTLNLSGNNITSFDFSKVLQLSTLNLGSNKISRFDYSKSSQVQQVQNHLQSLDLSENSITLTHLLSQLKNLQSLNLSGIKIGLNGCRALSEVLPKLPNLQTLNLSANNISNNECEVLSSGLSQLPNLQTLNLSFNQISNEGCKSLIANSVHLQLLHLSFNQITDEGCIHLANYLPQLNNLQQLNLSFNQITDEGCRTLTSVLSTLDHFKALDLRGYNRLKGCTSTENFFFYK